MATSFWRFDIDTQMLKPSVHCRALHGLASDAPFSYSDYLEAIHPEDRKEHRKALEHAVIETGHFDCTYRIIWPDGSIHRVRSRGSASPLVVGFPRELVGASIELFDMAGRKPVSRVPSLEVGSGDQVSGHRASRSE
jgi:PAS fold